MVSVLEEIIPFSYYTNMSGVAADIKILEMLFRGMQPKLAEKLALLEVEVSIFALEWLVCIFTSTLPFYVHNHDSLVVDNNVGFIADGRVSGPDKGGTYYPGTFSPCYRSSC